MKVVVLKKNFCWKYAKKTAFEVIWIHRLERANLFKDDQDALNFVKRNELMLTDRIAIVDLADAQHECRLMENRLDYV